MHVSQRRADETTHLNSRFHQRVGYHEVELMLPNRQHGTRSSADHALGNTSHEQMRHGCTSMRADDDEIDVVVAGVLHDAGGRRGRRNDGLYDRDRFWVVIDQQVVQPLSRGVFDVFLQL